MHYLIYCFSYISVIFHLYCVIPMYVCTIMHVCTMAVLSSGLESSCQVKFLVCVNILGSKALSDVVLYYVASNAVAL